MRLTRRRLAHLPALTALLVYLLPAYPLLAQPALAQPVLAQPVPAQPARAQPNRAPPAAEAPVSLDQLMAALRTVRSVNARYVERRTLSALRTPLETRGTLRFDAPDRLEKIADPPGKGERLVIDADRLTMDRGDGKPITMSLSGRPEIGVLVESIRATLAGDGAALTRNFDMTLAGTLGQWQMVMQPRDPALRQILDWMRIDGAGPRVTAIETQDRAGDRSQMTITPPAP